MNDPSVIGGSNAGLMYAGIVGGGGGDWNRMSLWITTGRPCE